METSITKRALPPEKAEEVANRIWHGLMARVNRDLKPVFLAMMREVLSEEAPAVNRHPHGATDRQDHGAKGRHRKTVRIYTHDPDRREAPRRPPARGPKVSGGRRVGDRRGLEGLAELPDESA